VAQPSPAAVLNLRLDQIRAERLRRAEAAQLQRVAEEAEAIRDRCKTFRGFVSEAWPILEPAQQFVGGWHIDAMAEHLQAVHDGQIQHLAIHVPPGSMKSLLVGVLFPAWEWGPAAAPWLQYLTGSYEADLALRDNRKMRRLVSSPRFQHLWPLELTKAGDELFENAELGWRWARAFKSMTGGRGHRVLLDDPHSTDKAESATERGKTVRTFRESILDRLNDVKRDSIIVVMQRLHSLDIGGCIEELDIGFERLVIPMEYDPTMACRTSIDWQDPRTKDGELMCPERWDAPAVAKLKKGKGSYAWAGQYGQRPVPREGGMFKEEWFVGKILDYAPPGTRWVRHWDLAATKREATDTAGARTAGVKLGKAPDGSFIVGDCKTAAEEGKKIRRLVRRTAEVDGFEVEISIPQDPGAAGKTVYQDYATMLPEFNVRKLIETGDKETRAEPLSAQAEAGNVYLLRGHWNKEWIDEMCLFPGGPRKDIPDASSGAYAKLVGQKERNSEIVGPKFVHGLTD